MTKITEEDYTKLYPLTETEEETLSIDLEELTDYWLEIKVNRKKDRWNWEYYYFIDYPHWYTCYDNFKEVEAFIYWLVNAARYHNTPWWF